MKYLLMISMAMTAASECAFGITYQTMEYKPKGKNYSLPTSAAVYGYSPDVNGTETIWIMYGKRKNNDLYITCMLASKRLEQKLPLPVLRYIGNNVVAPKLKEMKSIEGIKTIVKNAVEKALDQQYKNNLLTEGAKMAQDSSYFRGHCNTNWWMPNYYYDFAIAFDTAKSKPFLTNVITDKNFASLAYVTEQLKQFGYHHDIKSLVKWPKNVMSCCGFEREKYKFVAAPIEKDQSFHLRKDSCRFILKKTAISHGEKYPLFASVSIFGWYATYCNFFASDLQKRIFGRPLWLTNGCANDFTYLKSQIDFVEIRKTEVQQYSGNGYFVFLINDVHVSTIYPTEESGLTVVQAGGDTGILKIEKVWRNFSEMPALAAYVYLGHLKN